VSGTVRGASASGDAVAHASVEVLRAGTALADTASSSVIATTSTDETGAFRAAFLAPGTYALRVTPPAASAALRAVLVSSVVVESAQDTPLGPVVLP
jgi:protocatechuate 3,4-dioxygenase beta subunit